MTTTYRGLTLDTFQAKAIESIKRGQSVIVSAPTGTGKTLIADYLIEHIIEDGGEIIYTSPIKALSNQKYRQYAALFGEEKVGLITGDIVINRDAPVKIMTTEILRNILLESRTQQDTEQTSHEDLDALTNAHIPSLENLQAVIIDEIHFLADPDRGTVWEELLIYLPTRIRILGLSATLSNLEEFTDWLSEIRQSPMEIIYEPKRTVPLKYFMVNNDTGMVSVQEYTREYSTWLKSQKGKKKKKDHHRGRGRRDDGPRTNHIDVIESLHAHSFPALYFIFSRAMVERLAYNLAVAPVGKRLAPKEITQRIKPKLDAFDKEHPDLLTNKLRHMYMQGIAFHHAGLNVRLKGLVEELYEMSLLRVLYCTSTFALGINMPARTVIFDGLSKYNGQEIAPLTVREFMQMAGRAGRRGIDTEGDIIIKQDFQDFYEIKDVMPNLLKGASEPVTSSFNLSFHTIVHLLERFEPEQIRAVLQRSFKAHQSLEHAELLRHDIERKQSMLESSPLSRINTPTSKQRQQLKRLQGEIAQSKRALMTEERPRLWEDFLRKVEFLRTYGYIDEHYNLLGPAQIMKPIKIEEILLSQLVLSGVLEPLNDSQLFGVVCGLVSSLPRKTRVERPDASWKYIFEDILEVRHSPVVEHSEQLTQQDVTCTFEIMPIGQRWAKGDSLAEIMEDVHSPTDLSGDLVGAFRRGKDILSQLREVYSEDEDFQRRARAIMQRVTRDEVQVLY